jgi:hypothetical protein
MVLGSGIRDPRYGIRDPEKTHSGSRIPDPGVKKAPDPGFRIRIRNTDQNNNVSGSGCPKKFQTGNIAFEIFKKTVFFE